MQMRQELNKTSQRRHEAQPRGLMVNKIRLDLEAAKKRKLEAERRDELSEKKGVLKRIGERKLSGARELSGRRKMERRKAFTYDTFLLVGKAVAVCLLVVFAGCLLWPRVNPPRSPWKNLAPEAPEFTEVRQYISQIVQSWKESSEGETVASSALRPDQEPDLDEVPLDLLANTDFSVVSLQVNRVDKSNKSYVAVCDFREVGRYVMQLGRERDHFNFQEISFY